MKNLVKKGKKVAPLYNHVVVRDLNDSSRYFPVKNEAGIIRANGSSFDDGIEEYNVASSIMGIGEVIAVGPEVKMVKPEMRLCMISDLCCQCQLNLMKMKSLCQG